MVKAGIHWGPWSYANGPGLWWEKFPTATALIAVPALAGLVALPFWLARSDLRRVGALLGFGALAHAGAMIVLNVAPFHWYYAPAVGSLTVLAALACARIRRPVVAIAPVAVLAAVAPGSGVACGVPPLAGCSTGSRTAGRSPSRCADGLTRPPGSAGRCFGSTTSTSSRSARYRGTCG